MLRLSLQISVAANMVGVGVGVVDGGQLPAVGVQVLADLAVESIPLPGHFFDMVGFRTEDGVVYLADCLSSRETLDKYQISFIYDVAAYLDTLERVKAMEATVLPTRTYCSKFMVSP